MSLDGVFDHTAGLPDAEIHQHYAELLKEADVILYGRITYQLMQFWQNLLKNPSGDPSMDDFAVAIDQVPKIVFSRTLEQTGWDSARLADQPLKELVTELRMQPGRNIFAGSRSIISSLARLNLIDEYQICVYPVIAGSGKQLFESFQDRSLLELITTKTMKSGAVILFYKPKRLS